MIPDGSGGTLASWFDNLAVTTNPADGDKITHFDSSGNANTFVVPLTRAWGVSGQDGQNLVLGENNAAFATDSVSVTAFDIDSGAVLWRFIPGSEDSIQLLAADAPGGVTVLGFDSNTGYLSNEVTFDASGSSIDPPLNGNIVEAMYLDDTTLLGLTVANQLIAAQGTDPLVALSQWALPNGAPKSARLSDPALKLVGVSDCTTNHASQFERQPVYKLRTSDNSPPNKNYTVFEELNPNKFAANCPNHPGETPCDYADFLPSTPFNEFDDDLFIGFSPAFSNTQTFRYGRPGERKWDVHRIERTVQSLSTLQIKQVPTDNVDHLSLSLAPQQEPLIDGFKSPYIGPNCAGQYPQAK